LLGIQFALLIGGAVITETVFARPGIGTMLVTSVLQKDLPMVQALVLYTTGAYIVLNFIVDMLYGIIDPRIREARAA
jgi:ABC-type dipeptide/oligopeptide/nickel transport system permease component